MKNSISTIIILLLYFTGYAQYNGNDYRSLADKAFANKNYYEAAHYYQKQAQILQLTTQVDVPFQNVSKKAAGIIAENIYISYRLAESFRLYENYLEAEGWYSKVLSQNAETRFPLARLWYGVCLRANQHFDESIKQLVQFTGSFTGNEQYLVTAKKEIANCRFAQDQYRHPTAIEAVKMKSPWNSDGSDYAIFKQGTNYWYTSSRLITGDQKHLNRIYRAFANDNYKPQMVRFNSDENKNELEYGTPAINAAGTILYFTRWYKEGRTIIHAIYYSIAENGGWSAPKKLNTNVNAEGYNAIQPFITADGKQMYFASNKPGGQGGFDIWVSTLGDDGMPVNSINLGGTVNTPLDEQSPYYDKTSGWLIYSSKGFLGLGGFDFFKTQNLNGQWTAPQNMGYPMNSAKDDLYYYQDKNDNGKIFISSDRESDCCLDLFEVHNKSFVIAGSVTDCDTRLPLNGVSVKMIDSLSNEVLGQVIADPAGRYKFAAASRIPYNIVVEKVGYFKKVIPMIVTGKAPHDTLMNPDICLQTFTTGKPVIIKNILYDYDKATLRPQSEIVLNQLVEIMRNNPAIKIELAAHTDSIGSDAYNQLLSQQRAQACVDYVISKNISTDRIFAKGYGKARPVAPNTLPDGEDNPDGRQLNRRTEFTVLKAE